MTAELLLMRHGRCQANDDLTLNGRKDTKLVPLGRQQAREAALTLKNENIKIIYSSPLSRAVETAVIVAETLYPVDLDIEPLLTERDFGVLTGMPVTDIPLFAKDIIFGHEVEYFLDTDGAERYEMVLERAQKVLAIMQDRHAGEKVLLVTHGAMMQILWSAWHNLPWKQCLKERPYIKNAAIIKLNGRSYATRVA